jgi:hypothetical protein
MKIRKELGNYVLPFIASTLAAIVLTIIILMAVNTTLMRIPPKGKASTTVTYAKQAAPAEIPKEPEKEYDVIKERNLFRAKLQIEIPKPRSENEIEEESLANTVKDMVSGSVSKKNRVMRLSIRALKRESGVTSWVKSLTKVLPSQK